MPEEATVLLVEDDPTDAELAHRALTLAGLPGRVQLARDGEEALDFVFGRGAFEGRAGASWLQLILLDLKLPKVDGMEVLRAIKAHPRARRIPVVVLTSSSLPADIDRCYLTGANSYLVKPVPFDEHARALQSAARYWLVLNTLPEPDAE
jgi:CheY-like chemotaxis protein